MVNYSLDPVELQWGLMDTASQARTISQAQGKLSNGDLQPSLGDHTEVARLSTEWGQFLEDMHDASGRVTGAMQRKATGMRDAAQAIERGDASMEQQASTSLSKLSDGWGTQR